jgi:Polysaccharide biosynthesis protein
MRCPGVNQPPGSESAATIRDRGAAGAAVLLTARQAAQVVAFIGTLVLAHLLTPTTLGMMALGMTIVTVGMVFADSGLGAALVRKTQDPTVDELRTLSRHATRIGVRDRAGSGGRRIPDGNRRQGYGDHGLLARQGTACDCAGASARLPADSGDRVCRVARLLRMAIATVEVGWGVRPRA